MEAHQKCDEGNPKLMYYIMQSVHYPRTLSEVIYASQLIQAEAVRANVEHMRRNRGICMGSLYWQLNDSNPVISWSSIDYFGRRKALHYYAKRFYTQVLLTAEISSDNSVLFNVSNERLADFSGKVHWRLRKNSGETVIDGAINVEAKALSAAFCARQYVFPDNAAQEGLSARNCVLEYSLIENNARLSTSCSMFTEPKDFRFADPKLSFTVDEISGKMCITLRSAAYAKGVRITADGYDLRFTDNWFDMFTDERIVFIRKSDIPEGMTAAMISNQLSVTSYYDEMGLGNR